MRDGAVGNERGIAMVIALLLMLVVTLLGINAISTSIYETNISGNERTGADAFYAAEAGVQVGLDRLPGTGAVGVTKVGQDSYSWTGSPGDKGSPKTIAYLGTMLRTGYDATWGFKRFQVNASGESLGSVKEVEVQATYGPITSGTSYNN